MKLKKNTKKKLCKKVTSLEKNTLQFLISNLKQRFYLIQNLPEKPNGTKPYFDLKTKNIIVKNYFKFKNILKICQLLFYIAEK